MLTAVDARRNALTIGALGLIAFAVGAVEAFTLTHASSGTAFSSAKTATIF